jgi:hypothetical protein
VAEVAASSDGVVFFCGLSPEKLVSCYALSLFLGVILPC